MPTKAEICNATLDSIPQLTNPTKSCIMLYRGDTMNKGRFDISDKQWDRIRGVFPPEKTGKAGRPCEVTNCNVWNGAIWIARTGA